jgi:hypothetical protein
VGAVVTGVDVSAVVGVEVVVAVGDATLGVDDDIGGVIVAVGVRVGTGVGGGGGGGGASRLRSSKQTVAGLLETTLRRTKSAAAAGGFVRVRVKGA